MKKIPTLFVRDEATNRKQVKDEVTPGCEWVLAGEGAATRKYDGTCVMYDGERWWTRREVKPGKQAPDGFVELEHDETTGKTVGWEPAEQSAFWKVLAGVIEREAWLPYKLVSGTYELLGPKVNGNPEALAEHLLVAHGYLAAESWDDYRDVPRDFDALSDWLLARSAEGIVWHHPDGRMAKLKRRDLPSREPRKD